MTDSTAGKSADRPNEHLERIAPELRAALAIFPDIDFSDGLAPFRGGFQVREPAPLPPHLAEVTCTERFIPGPAGAPDVRVLHYVPPGEASGPRPALLHIHGGGYVLGNPEQNDLRIRATAREHGCVVIATSYRLAPETPFPGALEDCHAALCWLADNAESLNVDPARIAIGGDSAGGGHAVALALHVRNRRRETGSGPAIRLMLLDAPMLDDRTGSTSDPHPHTGHFVWTPDKNRFGWGALLGREPGGPDVPEHMVPARVQDLSDLPPAFISVGAADLFVEENLEFARRLTRAGVPVELHLVPGAYHGFGIASDAPQTAQALAWHKAALSRAFGAIAP